MSDVIIERFNNNDLDDVVLLIVESFKSKFSALVKLDKEKTSGLLKDIWGLSEDNPKDGHYIAKIDGVVVGALMLNYTKQRRKKNSSFSLFNTIRKYGVINTMKCLVGMSILEHKPQINECYIEHIAIKEEYRNKKIGKRLLEFAKENARSICGVNILSLSVAKTNKNAIGLYDRIGFINNKDKEVDSLLTKYMLKEEGWFYMEMNI